MTLNTQKKEDRKISDTLIKPFSSILKDNLQSVEYIQSNNDDIQEIITTGFEILLTSRNTLPFLDTEITLSKLDNDQNYLLGATDIKKLIYKSKKAII
ncbi:pathogenicity deteminant pdpA1 domain protein [Francisella tularensis subsp. tularensis str. SCHU S4 substr. NR-28534]|nr:pathogenicity deteminant pdpA1 domain protein [Francisella tularensis subsp. tularensis str. SCHU S4 substr. NR-28534]